MRRGPGRAQRCVPWRGAVVRARLARAADDTDRLACGPAVQPVEAAPRCERTDQSAAGSARRRRQVRSCGGAHRPGRSGTTRCGRRSGACAASASRRAPPPWRGSQSRPAPASRAAHRRARATSRHGTLHRARRVSPTRPAARGCVVRGSERPGGGGVEAACRYLPHNFS
jgi:hypothetical protein